MATCEFMQKDFLYLCGAYIHVCVYDEFLPSNSFFFFFLIYAHIGSAIDQTARLFKIDYFDAVLLKDTLYYEFILLDVSRYLLPLLHRLCWASCVCR